MVLPTEGGTSMAHQPESGSPSPRRGRVVVALLGVALLLLLARPADAAGLSATTSTKATSSFEHDGQKITVWRYEPKTKAKGKHPALVMLYGMDCLAESPDRYEFVAQR